MNIVVVTLFPEMVQSVLGHSIIKRAIDQKKLTVEFINIRDYGIGNYRQVDDTPYGGGVGMVLRADVVVPAILTAKKTIGKRRTAVILLTPQGKVYDQKCARSLADDFDGLILVCGHYEGFDERIRAFVDQEISIGDYVLTGGELPACVLIDSIARLTPGVLGKDHSAEEESFENDLLEYPQYTRPEIYENFSVPEVLRSGNHKIINNWRLEESKKRTKKRRPDLAGPKTKKNDIIEKN
jgi:tRNA (guanine37-N1)-methyltransferase